MMSSGSSPSGLPNSTTPPMDPKVRRQKLSLLSWIRIGLGALAGALAGLMNFLSLDPSQQNLNAYYGLYVAVLLYLVSYYIAKYVLRMNLQASDKNKLITQGLGSYIVFFLFVWIVYNTICTLPGALCIHI